MDAAWKDRRVYGSDLDDPDPGPVPGHFYVELAGGPLDGQLLDVTGWSPLEMADGALLVGGDGDAVLLLAFGQDLEEQFGAVPVELHVAEFVDAEEIYAAVAGDRLVQLLLVRGLDPGR